AKESGLLKGPPPIWLACSLDGHPFDHARECPRVPTTCHVPTHAPTAGTAHRCRVRGTSRQCSSIRGPGAPRARKGRIAVRMEGSPVRSGVGSKGPRICRSKSRCGHFHAWSVPAQSRLGSGGESCRRKGEAHVPQSTSSAGTLPLQSSSGSEFPRAENRIDDRRGEDRVGWGHDILAACRSEERRVGKEGRYGWWEGE